MKTCSKCEIEKPHSEFHKRSGRASGLQSHCKDCQKVYAKTHKEAANARAIKYRQAHPDRVREGNRAWSQANRERRQEYNHKYNLEHQDDLKKYKREYHQANKHVHKAYYQANKEMYSARTKRWRHENPERNRELANMRFHRQRTNGPIDKDISLSRIRERCFDVCGICGIGEMLGDKWSIDHIIPVSKGGPHTWNNVQLAHLSCNVRKNATMPSASGGFTALLKKELNA